VAPLIQLFGSLDGQQFLEMGKQGAFARPSVRPEPAETREPVLADHPGGDGSAE